MRSNLSGLIPQLGDSRFEPLYDTVTIPSGALSALRLNFFTTPIGSTKGYSKTNLVTSGSLPTPQSQIVLGLRLMAHVTDLADHALIAKLAMDSSIRFFVGTKDYYWQSLGDLLGGITIFQDGLNSASGVPIALAQCQRPNSKGRKFPKKYPIKINSNESFGVEWIINTTATVNSATDFRLYLDGIRIVDVR